MIEHPSNKEDALDIIWGIVRTENQHWLLLLPGNLGATVKHVVDVSDWSSTKVRQLMEELVTRGQLVKRWNHQHQSYWSGHYSTLNELPHGGNDIDPDVSEIPF